MIRITKIEASIFHSYAFKPIDTANKKEGGRDSFELYTEREPCGNCKSHLKQDQLYFTSDKIHWSVPYNGDSGTEEIALLYQTQADIK